MNAKAKSFFSSIWFRCVSVLVIIAVVSGGLLAILNNVLFVSPKERTDRAIQKIYGELKEYSIELDVDNAERNDEKISVIEGGIEIGSINKVYTVGEPSNSQYDKLFQTTGYNGYKGGTITLWVRVSINNGTPTVTTVLMESFTKQTLMSKLGADYYNGFYVDLTDEYLQGRLFTGDPKDASNIKNIVTGASESSNAGCNAVNCVIKYFKGEL